MKKVFFLCLSCLIIGIFLSPLVALTTSGVFLKIPVGVRNIGMGETGATSGDINSPYWNPAGLSQISLNQALMCHSWLYENIYYDMLAFGYSTKFGVLGTSIMCLHLGDSIEEYDIYGNQLNLTYNPYNTAAILTYSNRFKGLNYGANFKYIYSKLTNIDDGSAVSFDFGAIYNKVRIQSSEFRVGLAVQNLGTKIKFVEKEESLPLNYKIGISKDFLFRLISSNDNILSVMFDINKPKYKNPHFNFGAEIKRVGTTTASFRIGYKTNTKGYEAIDGLSVGFGFSFKDYSLDYAFVPYGDLGDTHRISVIAKFGNGGKGREEEMKRGGEEEGQKGREAEKAEAEKAEEEKAEAEKAAEEKTYQESIKYMGGSKLSIALKAYHSKDYETATNLLVELLEENPKNGEAVALITKINDDLIKTKRQKIENEENERKKVILSVKKERKKEKSNVLFTKKEIKKIAEKFYKKGLEYYENGNYELAMPEFDNALTWQPDNIEMRNKIKEATSMLDMLVKKQFIKQMIEKAYGMYSKGDLLNSLDEWVIIFELDPGNQRAKEYIKKITTVLSESQKEQHKNEIMNKRREVALLLLKRGDTFFYQKKYREAIEEWEDVFKIEPDNQQAKQKIAVAKKQIKVIADEFFNSGLQFFNDNDYANAIEKFNLALVIEPKYEKAIEYLAKAKVIANNINKNLDRRKIQQLYYTAADYYMNGQYARVKEILRGILKEDPANENAHKLMERVDSVIAMMQ